MYAFELLAVCRALGIPCRVVSNLVSAHDANASLTIDRYYTADMEMMDYDPTNPDGDDSIWNYHVWNDVWMARPDLPKGYGGWQAIDATPQETSDGEILCVKFDEQDCCPQNSNVALLRRYVLTFRKMSLFSRQHRDSRFLQNVGTHLPNHTASQNRRLVFITLTVRN